MKLWWRWWPWVLKFPRRILFICNLGQRPLCHCNDDDARYDGDGCGDCVDGDLLQCQDLRNYTNDHNLDLDQDPLHPLGIWNDIHASTDNFFWRVTNGTGAFGPGGIVSQNWINIGEKKHNRYIQEKSDLALTTQRLIKSAIMLTLPPCTTKDIQKWFSFIFPNNRRHCWNCSPQYAVLESPKMAPGNPEDTCKIRSPSWALDGKNISRLGGWVKKNNWEKAVRLTALGGTPLQPDRNYLWKFGSNFSHYKMVK